ncbi:MAG: peptide chain release factor N(5)-glutamine methyltransferase [candidate division WOR-3 bacterium]|uniref:Peptide chain release factor N(5)-glutamine methyltransferase n=2 Tax=candidate division WOR-3 bacterium TaxID=2052148 RepID=A0A7C1NPL0_UNCW3|nr:peptide chain release factor N(5)-glutamine methyltransferase [candidate division WOR-3 bacterium]
MKIALRALHRHLPAQLVRRACRFIPRDDAEYLAMSFFSLKRSEIYLSQKPVSPEITRNFWTLVKRAARGEPLQYLTNSAPFLNLDLYVDPRVFIPRPETEELALRVQQLIQDPEVIVDYGTGSGCLAIALAQMFPAARIFGIDISAPALAVARLNIRRYRLEKRIHLIQAPALDVPHLEFLKDNIDLLISNPPYVPENRIPVLEPRVRNYEPIIALDGGPEGTTVIRMLLQSAPVYLRKNGLLALEIDETQDSFVTKMLPAARIETDLAGKIRYAFWRKGGL